MDDWAVIAWVGWGEAKASAEIERLRIQHQQELMDLKSKQQEELANQEKRLGDFKFLVNNISRQFGAFFSEFKIFVNFDDGSKPIQKGTTPS